MDQPPPPTIDGACTDPMCPEADSDVTSPDGLSRTRHVHVHVAGTWEPTIPTDPAARHRYYHQPINTDGTWTQAMVEADLARQRS